LVTLMNMQLRHYQITAYVNKNITKRAITNTNTKPLET